MEIKDMTIKQIEEQIAGLKEENSQLKKKLEDTPKTGVNITKKDFSKLETIIKKTNEFRNILISNGLINLDEKEEETEEVQEVPKQTLELVKKINDLEIKNFIETGSLYDYLDKDIIEERIGSSFVDTSYIESHRWFSIAKINIKIDGINFTSDYVFEVKSEAMSVEDCGIEFKLFLDDDRYKIHEEIDEIDEIDEIINNF